MREAIARRRIDRWMVLASFLVLLICLPLLVLVAYLFLPAGDTWRHVATHLLPRYLGNTFALGLGVGLLSCLLGVAPAWFIATSNVPGKRFLEWLLILPLAIPTYIAAYAYAGLFDYAGPLHIALRHFEWPAFYVPVASLPGAICVMAFVLYPYVYLLCRTSFLYQSSAAMESARMLGCSQTGAFFRVALPMARPAMAGGISLVLMEVLNDYGAVHYYGVDTFTTGIFRAWFGLGDAATAVRLSVCLLSVALLLLFLERLHRGRAQFDAAGRTRHPIVQRLSRPYLAFGLCLLPIVLGFVIPTGQLIFWAVQSMHNLPPHFLTLTRNSFLLASGASLLIVAVACIVAFAGRLHPGRWMRMLSRLSVLGYVVPGAVIAIGVMLPFSRIDHAIDRLAVHHLGISTGLLLSGTLLALVFAYLVRFMAVAFNSVDSGYDKLNKHLQPAARSLGANPLRILWQIDLPTLRPALIAGLLLVFIDIIKELPLTLILRPFNFDTLATRAYELASDEMLEQSALIALVIIATGVLGTLPLQRLTRWKQS